MLDNDYVQHAISCGSFCFELTLNCGKETKNQRKLNYAENKTPKPDSNGSNWLRTRDYLCLTLLTVRCTMYVFNHTVFSSISLFVRAQLICIRVRMSLTHTFGYVWLYFELDDFHTWHGQMKWTLNTTICFEHNYIHIRHGHSNVLRFFFFCFVLLSRDTSMVCNETNIQFSDWYR